jgi:hypothetical protein
LPRALAAGVPLIIFGVGHWNGAGRTSSSPSPSVASSRSSTSGAVT